MKHALHVILLACVPALAAPNDGASVASPARDNSVETELASFEIADGYEVSLFASEEHGIANPIAMRWGPRGRLWVLCSLVYPQLVPTEPPHDKLYILEDTDHDGRADKSTVFADGLDMPTGFALGDGGVFLGEGDDLLFLKDTDGDDRADFRETIFSGFGTGDTHQNINSFAWSPGGELFFCQGLHCFSRIETPWGIERMDEHGVWRMRPKRRQLHAFRGGSGQNPWGVAFGHWGEPLVKGNNQQISELLPVMVHTGNRHQPLDIGGTRIKSMICEIVDSPALPEDIQGNILIAGYFAHIVDRMMVMPEGSGHRTELLPPLFRTDHQSFRPVDIQTGPDGAIYVADWYNPIIGHYQASLRHPDRDKKHGRIWRVTAKGMETTRPVDLTTLTIGELLDHLPAAPLRERERIRIELSSRAAAAVLEAIPGWFESSDAPRDRKLFEALCLHEWNEHVGEFGQFALDQLLRSENPLGRAYATRVAGRWQDRLLDRATPLKTSVADLHPRVRLEAVVAASYFGSADAITIATEALDRPMDRFLEAALVQCTHALREHWWPALLDGSLQFGDPKHLAFVLKHVSGSEAAGTARAMLQKPSLSPEVAEALTILLALNGNARDLQWVLEHCGENGFITAALVESAKVRPVKPAGDMHGPLLKLSRSGHTAVAAPALRLMGLWKSPGRAAPLVACATDSGLDPGVRVAAIGALGSLDPPEVLPVLREVSSSNDPLIRNAALRTIAGLDVAAAAEVANRLLRREPSDTAVQGIVSPFLGRKGGPAALAKALSRKEIDPGLAAQIQVVLGAAGRHSPALDEVLRPRRRPEAVGIPPYDEQLVRELAAEVKSDGDAKRGGEVYHRDALSCTICHAIDQCGGNLGPELTAVGAGLPVELIIEAILWPERQVKEGYLATTITTGDGRVVSGYVQTEDRQRIVIRDAASETEQTIGKKSIAERQDAGTLMPPGLTAGLTRTDLRDLVRFLAERKGGEPVTSSTRPRKPNFIVIMVDDMGYAGLSCFGNPHFETPELDRLAAEGMRLTDFHSSGTVCSPTRAGLLTGRYQRRTGVEAVIHPATEHPEHRKGLQKAEWTFAEALKGAGYATGLVGKWHQGYPHNSADYHPQEHGFDEFIGYHSGNIDFVSHVGDHVKHDWWHGRKETQEEGYSTHLINKYALEFIRKHKDEPFCLYVAHEAIHNPVQVPGDPVRRSEENGWIRWKAKNEAERIAKYEGMTLPIDEGVGAIRELLGELGLDRDTCIVFFSDNGPSRDFPSGDPKFRGGKGSVYEGGHIVPAIAWWPGRIPSGSASSTPAISIDIMPTLLSMSGAAASPDRPLDGVDLSPVLFEQKPLPPRPLFWASLSNGGVRSEAMRSDPWKLVVTHPKAPKGSFGNPKVELYHLGRDPGETTDLAAEERGRADRMMKQLRQWLDETAATATPQPGGW